MIANVESSPEECCGFLFGHERDGRHITKIWAASNATSGDKRKQFEIEPLEYLRAENHAAQNDLELLGIYHSHPNHPAIPSEKDKAAAQPFFSYVILSVNQCKFASIRSWRLSNAGQFEEETITTHL